MSDSLSPNFFDHPILSPSISAREAMPEDATPGALGKKYDYFASTRPGTSRNTSYARAGSKDTRDVPVGAAGQRKPELQPRSHSDDLRSGLASPVMPEVDAGVDGEHRCFHVQGTLKAPLWHCAKLLHCGSNDFFAASLHLKPTTEIRAGLVQKPFHIHTDLLVSNAPYFAALQKPGIVTTTNSLPSSSTATRLSGPFFFPHVDEFAFALFVRWIYGGKLHGPSDFHSMNHYICLYVLARDFAIDALKNNVMDLVRHYYHRENMTAPAYRLEYIYTYTDGPCFMREFLVGTAAYRAVSGGEQGGISESVKAVLRKRGDLAVDFAEALVRFVGDGNGDGRVDGRKGEDCRWHEHGVGGTGKCEKRGVEPWES